jgi:hypothetical protein
LKAPLTFSDFEILKNNNNKIVWDIQDYDCHSVLNRDFYWDKNLFENVDHCIFLNGITPRELSKVLKFNWSIISHHWDERLREVKSQKNNFVFGYYGCKESCQYLNKIDTKAFITSHHFYEENDMIDWMKKINCHCDIKHADSLNFFAKSALKLSTAAAVESNIILNKGFSSIEILDESYPYYVDNDEESFLNMIEFAQYSFGDKPWNLGLEMLMDVKVNTDLNRIIWKYVKLIESL